MQTKIPIIVIMLTVTFLMALPINTPVHAVVQGSTTAFAPFGPSTTSVLVHEYSDFNTMFKAFTDGLVDITDWPVNAGDIPGFGANSDFYLSQNQPEFGIFQMDFNKHSTPLGVQQQIARPAAVGSVTNVVTGTSTCGNGFGTVTLNVVNIEDGNTVFKDPFNQITIRHSSGNPSATVTDNVATKAVIYDADNSGTYTAGDTVISGAAPAIGTPLSLDYRLKFQDPTLPPAGVSDNLYVNAPSTWLATNAVVYDTDSSARYNAGSDFPADVVIAGAPVLAKSLQVDQKIKFVDNPAAAAANTPGTWYAGGTYTFPCLLAGTYTITSAMLSGATTGNACGLAAGCTIDITGSGTGSSATATWNAVWNSQSTFTTTIQGIQFKRGIAHMLDKSVFMLKDSATLGTAVCDDIMLAAAHDLAGAPCVASELLVGTGTPAYLGKPLPATLLNEGPNGIVAQSGTGWSVTLPTADVSLYNYANDIISPVTGLANGIGQTDYWWSSGAFAAGLAAGSNAGYSGLADIDIACQYLVLAGAGTLPAGKTCADVANAAAGTAILCTTMPCSYPHLTPGASATSMIYWIRTSIQRKHFGSIIADTINFMFGAPNSIGQCANLAADSGPPPTSGIAACTPAQIQTVMAPLLYSGPNSGRTLSLHPQYATIGAVVPIVFETVPHLNDWDGYTGGFSLGSTPDFVYSFLNSFFASNICGGPRNDFPSNYEMACDPQFDALSSAGEFEQSAHPTLPRAAAIFSEATVREAQASFNIPVYSRNQQFVENNGWNWQQQGAGTGASIALTKGHGTQTGFSALINLRQRPGYDPCAQPTPPANCALYKPGAGNPNIIRRGFSQDTDAMNMYQDLTVWDFEIISQVFDTMLNVNPNTSGGGSQVYDWMTTIHSSKFDPNELGCIPPPSVPAPVCVKGVTTQTWNLRNDIFFHDGVAVTCDDVVYSILTARDDPAGLYSTNAQFVTNAFCNGSRQVIVKLQSNSAFYEANIGAGIPIIPKHIWAATTGLPAGQPNSICGTLGTFSTPAGVVNNIPDGPNSFCVDANFDPMMCTGTGFVTAGSIPGCGKKFADGSVQGIFVGSGPFECKNAQSGVQASGTIGGTCILSSTGSPQGFLDTDASALLTAFDNSASGGASYMRGPTNNQGTSLQKESWADQNNDGQVNILDGSNMSFFFDQANPYWVHPQYACSPTATVVDVCVASALVVYFDEGLTSPFGGTGSPPSMLVLDPQIDPSQVDLLASAGTVYYQSTNTARTQLVILSGAPTVPSFSATATPVSGGAAISGSASISGSVITITWTGGLTSGTTYRINIVYSGIQLYVPLITAKV